jgi:hypothetical protein
MAEEETTTPQKMSLLMADVLATLPGHKAEELKETHVFVMHPVRFYEFAVEISKDNPEGLYEHTLEGAFIFGAEVQGRFAGIPVLSAANAPVFNLYLLKREDIERNGVFL